MKAPWMILCSLFIIQACTQPDIPQQQIRTNSVAPYIDDLNKFDNPDYIQQFPTSAIRPGQSSGSIKARLGNADRSHLISTETNYYNNNIDNLGVYEYNVDQLTQIVWYNNPGVDETWQTPDDIISAYRSYVAQNPDVIYTNYRNSGTDQTWFTADDDILYYYAFVKDAAGAVIGIAAFTLPGDDNVWFTSDDFIGWLTTENTTANVTRWLMYLGPGSDNNWLTLDDNLVYRFAETTLDANAVKQRHTYYKGSGIDGTPFTADDEIGYYHDYGYDTLGRYTQNIMFISAGTDNIWFTADDGIRSCKTLIRDANDLPTQTISYRPGADQTCFTIDDMIWGYHNDLFDTNNNLTETVSYYGSGPDTTWFTADDILIQNRTYR